MPHIEVLPQHTTASGANWTYTTLPPAHASSNALGSRGRTTRHANSSLETSAAQQRKIAARLVDLERENYRDTNIPVPKRETFGRRASLSLSPRLSARASRVRAVLTSLRHN